TLSIFLCVVQVLYVCLCLCFCSVGTLGRGAERLHNLLESPSQGWNRCRSHGGWSSAALQVQRCRDGTHNTRDFSVTDDEQGSEQTHRVLWCVDFIPCQT